MILDVFPSYKDKDMVDLLYQFERATGSSLNILVEKYLEKMLYKEGYLTVEIEGESLQNSIEESNREFRQGKKANDSIQVYYGELYFGYAKIEEYEEYVGKLKQFSDDELIKMSKNYWDYENVTHTHFLKVRLMNPTLSFEACLSRSRFQISYISSKDVTQIRHKKFALCTVKGESSEELAMIKNYLYSLSDEELSKLENDLVNSKKRREHILKQITRE